MTSRRSVWNDPELIELARRFVPATDDMTHLMRGDLDSGRFFSRFSEEGHYAHGVGKGGTRQGYYAVTPSGILLGSTNRRDPAVVAEMLRQADVAYAAMPKEKRLGAQPLRHRSESDRIEDALFPEGGLVLKEFVRDLPGLEKGAAFDRGSNWNTDFVWFERAEAQQLVPAAKVGATRRAPSELVRRLALFHLIDTVDGIRYGQRPLFQPDDIVEADLHSTVEAVLGSVLTLRFEGRTRARDEQGHRGVATHLLGHADWDSSAHRFTRFELVAAGTRWGGTGPGKSNDRAGETGAKGIGFTFELAAPTERVPPNYVLAY